MSTATTVICCPALNEQSMTELERRVRSWIGPCQIWTEHDIGTMEHNASRLQAVVEAVGSIQWVGSGLGAALGYWLGCRIEGAIRQAEMFEPFLGFNAPFCKSTRSGGRMWAKLALGLARHEWGLLLGVQNDPSCDFFAVFFVRYAKHLHIQHFGVLHQRIFNFTADCDQATFVIGAQNAWASVMRGPLRKTFVQR